MIWPSYQGCLYQPSLVYVVDLHQGVSPYPTKPSPRAAHRNYKFETADSKIMLHEFSFQRKVKNPQEVTYGDPKDSDIYFLSDGFEDVILTSHLEEQTEHFYGILFKIPKSLLKRTIL
jgi:hypothetical protein